MLHFDRKTVIVTVSVATTVVALGTLTVLTLWLALEIFSDLSFSESTKAPIRDKLVPFAHSDDDPQGPKVLYGFINHQGKVVIKDQFDDAGAFHEQRAPVRSGNEWTFIDTTGNQLPTTGKPAVFSRAREFSEGLAAARQGIGSWGFIDRNCQWVIKPSWRRVSDFRRGFAVVSNPSLTSWKNTPTGIIDKQGNYLVQPCRCKVDDHESGGATRICVEDLYGFLDTRGQISIKPQYKNALPFSESLAAVLSENGKWGFVDPSGLLVIPATFDECGSFREGFACASQGGVFGLIEHGGKFIIKPQFEFLSAIYIQKPPKALFSSEGLTPVAFDGRWGFAGRNGKIAIAPKYVDEDTFSEGLAVVGFMQPFQKGEKDAAPNPLIVKKDSEPSVEPEQTTVVYAKRDIAAGEEITEDAVEEREAKSVKDIPPKSFESIYEVTGRTAERKIAKGKVVSYESVSPAPEGFRSCFPFPFDSKINSGARAITFALSCPRLPTTLTPGQNVDIVYLDQSGSKTPTFTALVRKTRILALDSQFDEARDSSSEIKLITIEVDSRELGKLLKAAINGKAYILPTPPTAKSPKLSVEQIPLKLTETSTPGVD